MIVVDSSVWIQFFRKQVTPKTALLRDLAAQSQIIVGDLMLLEVLQGARDELHSARMERHLLQFIVAPMMSPALAIHAARNYRALRDAGITIRKSVDLIIGTYCIENGHTLLHADRGFDAMESVLGLAVVR